MGQKSISPQVATALIAVVVVVVGFFLYRGATGGTVTNGTGPLGQASPPMSDAAKQAMLSSARGVQQGGAVRP